MPKNVIITDATELGTIPLPQQTETYTVVSHSFIINETKEQLKLNGFEIESEEYCRNLSGEVALGVYHLTHGDDSDLGLMFTWANSYDKSMRFRCAIGGFVHVSGSRMIAGDMSNYGRIHTGDAKDQVKDHIQSQITSAGSYFSALCTDKDNMKDVLLSDEEIAELMGILYFKEDVLSSSQLINTKDYCKKSPFTYSTPDNSLWTIYNHCILALKKAHPKSWMEQQKDLHKIVKARLLKVTPSLEAVTEEVVDPAQTNLLDQIEEIEAEKTLEDKLDLAEEPATFNLDHIPEPEAVIEPEEEVIDTDLNESDASEADAVLVQDPGALSLEAHSTGEEETVFPDAPADLPVVPEDQTVESTEETVEETIPLEEQVATEYIEPVTEAEVEASAPPIVDEPTSHELDVQSREETETAAENIDLVPEPQETTDIEDNSSNETLESPFEF